MSEQTPENTQHAPQKPKAPSAVAPAPAPAPHRVVPPMAEGDFQEGQFRQLFYVGYAKSGTTVADMLKRDYWAHVAQRMRPGTKIAVLTEDKRLYAEFIVFALGSTWAEVRQLGTEINVDKLVAGSGVADDFIIRDLGLIKKWGVIRVSDGREVKADGSLETEDAARAWLGAWLRSQGVRPAA